MISRQIPVFSDHCVFNGNQINGYPPSHPIFDKFIFDRVLIMLTSLPPIEFLTKNHEILGFEIYILCYPYYSQGQG